MDPETLHKVHVIVGIFTIRCFAVSLLYGPYFFVAWAIGMPVLSLSKEGEDVAVAAAILVAVAMAVVMAAAVQEEVMEAVVVLVSPSPMKLQ